MEKARSERIPVESLGKLMQLQSTLLAIGPDTQLTDVLTAIAETANDVLGGHFCVVQPYDQSSDRFLLEQFTPGGAPEAKAFKWTEPRKDGTARTALTAGLLTVEDYDQEVERYSFLAKGPGAFMDVADIKACLGIRLEAGGEWIGVLFVNYPEPHHFSDEEQNIAELFASQAALAIHNVRWFERERRTLSRLRGLIDISQSVSALRRDADLKEVLTKVVEAANEVLNADLSVIFSYDEETDGFLMEQLVAAGEGSATFEWQTPREKGATREILDQEAIITVNLQDAPDEWTSLLASSAFREHFQVQAVAGVPLRVGAEKVGVLYVNYQLPHVFDEQERNLVEAFANTAAIILHNAKLFDGTVRATTEFEGLLNITRDVTAVMADASLTLQTIIERAVKLVGTTRGAILLYHDGFGTVEAGYNIDPAAPVNTGIRFSTDTSLQKRIREERESVRIEDVATAKAEDLSKGERKEFLDQGIKSSLIVPMVVKDKVIGSIGLDETRERRSFTSREIELCQFIASQAGIAIENARLFEQISERLEQLLLLVGEIDEWVIQRGGEVEELAEFTLSRFLELFQFQAIWLLLREGQLLRIVATDPQHIEDKGRLLRLDRSITGRAASLKRVVKIDDIEAEPPYIQELYQPVHGGGMRSELAVPMIVEDQVIGVLNLESDEPAAFTVEDQKLLVRLARHLGVAIRSMEEMRERATLSEIAIEFSGSLDEGETAKSILDRALKLIGGQFGQILALEGEELVVRWATGGEGIGTRVRTNDSASGLSFLSQDDLYLKPLVESSGVILSGKSVIIPDVDRVDRYKRVIEVGKDRMQSELAVPIIVDDEVVGVFNVESPTLDGFTDKKQANLARFVQKRASEINKALRQRSEDELEELMQQGLDIVGEEFGQILRLDEEKLIIEYTKGDEPVGTIVEITRLKDGQWSPVTGQPAKEGTIVNVPDVSQDPRYTRYLGEEMKSELVIPLEARGEYVGVINLESPVPGYFTAEHARLLEPMASHAAVAIVNAAAYEALDRAREMEKLAETGRLTRDIIHRLNNPMGAIKARVEMLKQRRNALFVEDKYLQRSMEDIERNVGRVLTMVKEFREEADKERELQSTDVFLVIKSALDEMGDLAGIEVKQVALGGLPWVWADKRLELVFHNLFVNAVEAMPEGGVLEITGQARDGAWVDVRVRDTGRGIPESLLSEIFQPYYSTKVDKEAEPTHGLGLWWSRAFVERCGGTIDVESQIGEGTCFIVRLPTAVAVA